MHLHQAEGEGGRIDLRVGELSRLARDAGDLGDQTFVSRGELNPPTFCLADINAQVPGDGVKGVRVAKDITFFNRTKRGMILVYETLPEVN